MSARDLVDWTKIYAARRGRNGLKPKWHLALKAVWEAVQGNGMKENGTLCGKSKRAMYYRPTLTLTDWRGRHIFSGSPTPKMILGLNICPECKIAYAAMALRHEAE